MLRRLAISMNRLICALSLPLVFALGAALHPGHAQTVGNGPWQLTDQPVVTIGALDGAPEYLFDRVTGLALLPAGRVAVADLGSSSVRVYGPDGRHLRSIGRRGDGPGEFRQPTGVFAFSGDSLAVLDRLERFHVFGPGGDYVRSVRMSGFPVEIDPLTLHEAEQFPRIVAFLPDGSFVMHDAEPIRLSENRLMLESQTLDRTYWLVTSDGRDSTTLATFPSRRFDPHPENLILPLVFGPDVHADAGSDVVVFADDRTSELRWVGLDGTVTQVVPSPRVPRRVTDADIDQHVDHSAPPLSEDVARARSFATEVAPFSNVIVDATSHVWVQLSEPDHWSARLQFVRTTEVASTWLVFAPDGSRVGELQVPARLTPMAISPDRVWGLSRDDFEVERIVAFGIAKP